MKITELENTITKLTLCPSPDTVITSPLDGHDNKVEVTGKNQETQKVEQ